MIKRMGAFLSLQIALAMLLSVLVCPAALADGCEHTNFDRYTLPTYESIAGNNEVHKVTIWMQTTCLDCFETIADVPLTTTEEPHQFESDGAVLTCKWCEYQTTEEAMQATPVPTKTPAPTLLNEVYTWGDYKYKLFSNGDAEISKGTTIRGAVTIPERIDGHRVVSVGSQAFYGNNDLTSIIIPDGVQKIGDGAFIDCASLKKVTLHEGITSIDHMTFFGCSSLTNIDIPESVTFIGHQAFGSCTGLMEVNLPGSKITIGSLAFSFCTELTGINIPANTTIEGKNPFWGCSKLANIQVAANHPILEFIDDALIDKEKDQLICYPAGSTATEYRIPEGILTIGEYAFYGCATLTKVAIPETVTSIGDRAFEKCLALRNVNVPESVVSIGYAVFYNCPMLTIHCNEQIAFYFGALTPEERFADYVNVWPAPVRRNLPKGQKIEIYTGPDRSCAVAVNGTARLNTNDSFEVWGYRVHWNTKEKWYLVRYKSNNNGGIGYINENDFSGSIDCAELPFTRVWSIPYDTVLITDDPDGGQRTLIAISNDQPYTNYLATYKGKTGDWYYVEYDEYDPPVYGFIPAYTIERLTGW